MPLSESRRRLRNVKTAGLGSAGKALGGFVDDLASKGGDFIDGVRESTGKGIAKARERIGSAYEKANENLTPGMAAGGAAATGGAGYLAGGDKEASTTNRFLQRLEAE